MTGTSNFQIQKISTIVPELTGTYSLTAGTLTLNGAGAQTMRTGTTGGSACYNLVLGGSGAKTITGLLTINGDVTVSGTATMAANSAFIQACAKTFTYSSTGSTILTASTDVTMGSFSQTAGSFSDNSNTITICGSSFARSGGTFTANGTVAIDGSPTTVSGAATTTFHNITINPGKTLVGHATSMNVKGPSFTNEGTYTHNSGTVSITGNVTVLGASTTTFNHLTITSGILTGHATNMNVEGNFTNNSTFAHNSGTVTFTGGSAHNIAGTTTPTTFYNLTVNKTAGTTLTQTVATVSVSNLLTMTSGTYDINTNTLSGAGGFTATGGDLQIAKISTTVPQLTGTYAISGGTVTLDGAGAQTLNTSASGANTYYNLVFATSGTKTITGLTTINGNVTVSGSCVIASNSAFIQDCSKTFTYSSTGTTTMAAATNFTVGAFSMSLGTFNINANTMSVCGTGFTKTGGTFTTTGTVQFNGSAAQTLTGAITFSNMIMNNSSTGLTINNTVTITTSLTLTQGNITTGSNYMIMATGSNVSRTTGHVIGFLRKTVPVGASTRTYEVGTSAYYLPVDLSFTGTTVAGGFACKANNGDHPSIYGSSFNPSKTVNAYWTFVGGPTLGTYSATFNYDAALLDPSANYSNFTIQRYRAPSWNSTTIGTLNPTSSQCTGLNQPSAGNTDHFQIGEDYNATLLYNRLTGTQNWSEATTWIQERTGTITTSTGTATVTGTGTLFCGVDGTCGNADDEVLVGDMIMSQTSPGTIIGTVASVTNNTNFSLTANAASNNTTQAYGKTKVPDILDHVNIGNPNISGAAVNIIVDAAGIANKITFTSMAQSNALTHNAGMSLNIATSVIVNQPSANTLTNTWAINDGTAALLGNLSLATNNVTLSRVARVALTTGTLNIGNNLIYNSAVGAAVTAVLDLSGGAGQVNLGGDLTLTNGTGTITPGTTSIFNYNGSIDQTVTLGSSLVYCNLYANNTGTNGLTLGAAVTAANVVGDVVIQTGIFNNGGLAMTGNASKTLQQYAGTIFNLTGTAAFPTGFGTFTFDPTANTYYLQTNAQTISAQTYGNLYIQPQANGITHTFPGFTTLTVQGTLTCGDGVYTVIAQAAGTGVDIYTNHFVINPNTTYTATALYLFHISGDWTNNSGTFSHTNGTITFVGSADQLIQGTATAETFYNLVIAKTAGTVSTAGSINTINAFNFTNTSGNFIAPSTLDIDGNVLLTSGNVTAGALTYFKGNWTNNGATFIPNAGTLVIDGAGAQIINGTATTQTFYDVVLGKTAGTTLSTGGSTTTLTFNEYTQFTGNFTAPATMNFTGDVLISSGVYTASTNTNLGGDITYNGGTLTLGANTVTFNGSSAQLLSGTSTYPNFNNLIINASTPVNAVTLGKPITVTGGLTLTNGHLITTSTNLLTMNSSSSITLNAPVTQDSSFIKGPMKHIWATTSLLTKTFPVGKNNRMHRADASLQHTAATATDYTGEYIGTSARDLSWTLASGTDRVSAIGYWDINQGIGSSVASANVKLYYFPEDQVTDVAYLTAVKGNPSTWSDIGGTGTANGTGTITSSVNFTTFSFFTFANKTGGTNVLPVELTSFSGKQVDNTSLLRWETSSERNNSYFAIERSTDNVNFAQIGVHASKNGNANFIQQYEYEDLYPAHGVNYYRLKQVDTDGEYGYSKTVAIRFVSNIDKPIMDVYPNPVNVDQVLTIQSRNQYLPYQEVMVVLRDIQGKEFYSKVIITDEQGGFISAVDLMDQLPAGTYIVTASSEADMDSKVLIIR